jgi:hypothetical protein
VLAQWFGLYTNPTVIFSGQYVTRQYCNKIQKETEAGLTLCNVPVIQLADLSWQVMVHWLPLK